MVVAPPLVPSRAGNRLNTDRRDTIKFARLLGAETLTAVWVPDARHEAMRDLVCASGRCAKSKRLRLVFPHGRRKTTTLVAGLRISGIVAPTVLDGPINGEWFARALLAH